MSNFDLPPPVLITRAKDLHQAADSLLRQSVVAVDTESNSLHAYREQVCLIQFSTSQTDYLVDPLALSDLSPLAPLFGDPHIEKVFHAAEYDLITLKRDFGFAFANLFDTMVAARILGWEEVGLGAILKAEFGVQLDKRYQRANWGQRPLPADLMNYARLDTHYLIPLQQRMKAALQAAGRWSLAEEDFRRLPNVNGRDPEEGEEAWWRINGSYDLPPQQAAILQELCRYRDRVARTINRPIFKIIGDRALLEIAKAAPRNFSALQKVATLHPRIIQRHGEALLRAVRRGLSAGPIFPPRSPRPNDQYLARLEALRLWRKTTAQQMGVGSDVVMPRDLLYILAGENPRSREELANILNQAPWRLERFGDDLLKLLAQSG
jgi:ribonuclease D